MAREEAKTNRAIKVFPPESIREKINSLIRLITQPGYHGGFTVSVEARDGSIYRIKKEVSETELP